MIVSVSHPCGHAYKHVLYGSEGQLLRQRKELVQTRCPDCFHAKVVDALAVSVAPVTAMKSVRSDRRRV